MSSPSKAMTAPPFASRPAPVPARRHLWVLALLCSTEFIVIMDFSITAVALEPIQLDLGFMPGHLQWVVNAYGVAIAGFLLFGGRAADLYGRRRVFLAGLFIFTAASLAGGFAGTPAWLIATRALQGLGAALVSPAALSLLVIASRDARQRAKAIGVWGAVGSSGLAAGLLLGGAITDYASWRWVLWVNVPLGIAALVAAPFLLGETRGPRRPLDIPGALLATAGLLTVVYAFAHSEQVGLANPITVGLVAGGLLLLALFMAVEKRVVAPLLPPAFLRRRAVAAANLVSVSANASLAAAIVVLSLHLSTVTGLSALATGLALLPLALALLIASFSAAPIVLARLGVRATIAVGLLVSAAGLVASAAALPGSGDPWVLAVLPATVLAGAGYGLAYPAWTAVGVDGTPDQDQGLAAGVLTTSQEVGAAVGLALLTGVAATAGGGDQVPAALADGHDAALYVGAALAAVGALLAIAFPSSARLESLSDGGAGSSRSPATGRRPVPLPPAPTGCRYGAAR